MKSQSMFGNGFGHAAIARDLLRCPWRGLWLVPNVEFIAAPIAQWKVSSAVRRCEWYTMPPDIRIKLTFILGL